MQKKLRLLNDILVVKCQRSRYYFWDHPRPKKYWGTSPPSYPYVLMPMAIFVSVNELLRNLVHINCIGNTRGTILNTIGAETAQNQNAIIHSFAFSFANAPITHSDHTQHDLVSKTWFELRGR